MVSLVAIKERQQIDLQDTHTRALRQISVISRPRPFFGRICAANYSHSLNHS
jgi:hypothetical protein